jgi:hypothetical protein
VGPVSGPFPAEHRPWCDPQACELVPERSIEGIDYSPADTMTSEVEPGETTTVRLIETVPDGGVNVLLVVTEQRMGATSVAGVQLPPGQAFQLAGWLSQRAAVAVRHGGPR